MMRLKHEEIRDLISIPGNEICADCGLSLSVERVWASYSIGVFICNNCATIHRRIGTHVTSVRALALDEWDSDDIEFLRSHGNSVVSKAYLQHVPNVYQVPHEESPFVQKEQWIRAKYERKEFINPESQLYMKLAMEGNLHKRGKNDKVFNSRKFILNKNDGTLQYFIKEGTKLKATLKIQNMNIMMAAEKIGNKLGMQMTYQKQDEIRFIYVFAENGKSMIDWFTAIRHGIFLQNSIAFPNKSEQELLPYLTRDFTKEGWLQKCGPNFGDVYRKRWVSLDWRHLMYFEDPMDPYPKGEVNINDRKGFDVLTVDVLSVNDKGYPFVLKTPGRNFHFLADTRVDQDSWVKALRKVMESPISPKEISAPARRKRRSIIPRF